MANVKISALGAATELITEAVIPGSQGGTTKKFTIRQIQSEYSSLGVGYTISQNHTTFNGTLDKAFTIGYNVVAGTAATKIDPNEPIIKWDLEHHWNAITNQYMEANVNYVGIDGTARRPFGIMIDRDTHNIQWALKSGANEIFMYSDNGKVSIGAGVTALGFLDIRGMKTFASYGYGIYNIADITSTGETVYGLTNVPRMTPADTKNANGATFGGTIIGTAGQTKNAYTCYVSPLTKEGTFTITNAYSLYVEGPTIGTNNYSIYVVGGMSRIGNNVGINTDPALDSMLKIGGTNTSYAGYVFGLNYAPSLISSTQHTYGVFIAPNISVPTGKEICGLSVNIATATWQSGGSGDCKAIYVAGITTETGTCNTEYGVQVANITKGTTNYSIYTGTGRVYFGDTVGVKVAAPSALLHLPATTAAAGTASMKINAGTLLTTEEAGAIESDGTHLYWTNTAGTRIQLDN